jgi:hypothetical protein
MKKYYIFISLLCLSFILKAQDANSAYNFPIKPGVEEWSNLKTEDERFEAMQVPIDLLTSMSAENLIVTCINYPAFGHFSAFNNVTGMTHLIEKFNGLQELLIRNDTPVELYSMYSIMDSLVRRSVFRYVFGGSIPLI